MILYVYLCTCICRDGGYGRFNEARVPSRAKPALGQQRHSPHAERARTVSLFSSGSAPRDQPFYQGLVPPRFPRTPPSRLARALSAGSDEWRPGGEVIFEEGRSMTFLPDFRIAFLLLWIKGKEKPFSTGRFEGRLTRFDASLLL